MISTANVIQDLIQYIYDMASPFVASLWPWFFVFLGVIITFVVAKGFIERFSEELNWNVFNETQNDDYQWIGLIEHEHHYTSDVPSTKEHIIRYMFSDKAIDNQKKGHKGGIVKASSAEIGIDTGRGFKRGHYAVLGDTAKWIPAETTSLWREKINFGKGGIPTKAEYEAKGIKFKS